MKKNNNHGIVYVEMRSVGYIINYNVIIYENYSHEILRKTITMAAKKTIYRTITMAPNCYDVIGKFIKQRLKSDCALLSTDVFRELCYLTITICLCLFSNI